MRRGLYVPLAPDAVEKLADRARLERRTPQEQAAVILEESLGLRSRATGERTPQGVDDQA